MSAVGITPVGRATLDRLEQMLALFGAETEALVLADASFDAAVTETAFVMVDGGDAGALLQAAEQTDEALSIAEARVQRIGILVASLVARVAATMPPALPSGKPS